MIFATISSPPTKSAPASCASRTFSPLAMTKTRTDLPRPCGRTTVPRTTWSECFGSTPKLMASSTVSLNLVWCVFLISSLASASLYGRASTFLRAFSMCLPAFFIASAPRDLVAPELLGFHDFQTHVARRTHHGAHRGVQICGVEIDQLDLGNLLHLLFGDFANFVAIWFRRALYDTRRAQQQDRSRRRLQNEREGAVRINGYQHGENHSVRLLGRLGVELLAKIHDVQAMRTQRRAHRRSRRRFACRQLQFDRRLYFLSHVPASISFYWLCYCAAPQPSFSTLAKSSSTGVERPKIVTETFSRLWSLSISSTVPLKFAKGPSTMRTCSLRSNTTFGFGRSVGTCTRLMMASTSVSDSGEGAVAEPTKPVTRGVERTMCQVFSSRSISTSTYPGYVMREETTFLPPRTST